MRSLVKWVHVILVTVEDRSLSAVRFRDNKSRKIEVRVKIIVFIRNFILKGRRWGIWDQEKNFIFKMKE